jgi:hypothetical protein
MHESASVFVIDETGRVAGACYKVSPKATVALVTGALMQLELGE